MRIVLTSDWHGLLPDVPECDLLVIAGDLLPDSRPFLGREGPHDQQARWFLGDFLPHVTSRAETTVFVWGNHDYWGEEVRDQPPLGECPHDIPGDLRQRVKCLQDSGTVVNGVSLYGVPYVTNLSRWAFNRQEGFLAEQVWPDVPHGTDILISHAPPLWYGDAIPARSVFNPADTPEHVGCHSLYQWLLSTTNPPRLVVSGHIHAGWGDRTIAFTGIRAVNVAYVNDAYAPQHRFMVLDWPEGPRLDLATCHERLAPREESA